MKIKQLSVIPLHLPLKTPYIWSQGVEDAFFVNLIIIESEDGTRGYGENTTAPDAAAQKLIIEKMAPHFVGKSVFDFALGAKEAFRANFLTFGGNMPRFFNQMISGIEMAILDLQGKVLGRPVWDLLGGQQRPQVGYFYFLQGKSVDALAADARHAVKAGHPIIYLKVGVSEAHDLAAVSAVRNVIDAAASPARLRLDANEAWDPATARRMIRLLAPYQVEYIEQPTPSWSLEALKQVTDRSEIPIGADQSVFTLHDVYRACATRSADMIAVGPREIGGLRATMKAAAIAEGAGLNLCIHSSMTTGITTCAEHHLGRAIPNLDDGNQIMWQLLQDNIVTSPSLTPVKGELALPATPGLGVTLDFDVINQAASRFEEMSRK